MNYQIHLIKITVFEFHPLNMSLVSPISIDSTSEGYL